MSSTFSKRIYTNNFVQKLTRYLDYGAAIVLLGSTYIGGPGFFSLLYSIYTCNNLQHWSHSCKDTSVCYKKTMLNIDWRDILPLLYFDEIDYI